MINCAYTGASIIHWGLQTYPEIYQISRSLYYLYVAESSSAVQSISHQNCDMQWSPPRCHLKWCSYSSVCVVSAVNELLVRPQAFLPVTQWLMVILLCPWSDWHAVTPHQCLTFIIPHRTKCWDRTQWDVIIANCIEKLLKQFVEVQ